MILKTVPYTRMLRLEVAAFAEDVIYVIKKNDPELLNIDKVYNLLVAQQPNINLLTEEYGSHPVTQLIIPVRRKFIRYVRSIVYRMGLVVFEDASNFSTDVLEAQAVTKDYLYRLDRCRSERERIGRVTGFLQTIDDNTEINAAFTKFQLMGDVELLRNAHSTLKSLLSRRMQSISENPHINMRELTGPVIKALKNMFKQVEIAVLINDGPEYEDLFYQLDQTIVDFRNMVNRRLLYNKRKREAKKAIEKLEKAEAEESVKGNKVDTIEPVNTTEVEKPEEIVPDESDPKTTDDVSAPPVSNKKIEKKKNIADNVESGLNPKRGDPTLSDKSSTTNKNNNKSN